MIVLLFSACSHSTFAQTTKKYWVFFRDKGPFHPSHGTLPRLSSAYQKVLEYVTPRALARRAKVLPPDALVDAGDLPLYQPYLDRLLVDGGILQRQSRWLNAASFLLTPDQLTSISNLAFVKRVAPVVVFTGRDNEKSTRQFQQLFKASAFDYGPSATQAQTINVPPLHELGITGHNTVIGMLDTGFRWRAHEALYTRRVIAEHDFIQNDDTTANQAGDSQDQDHHGTLTMSTIGGYMPGQLIGPAFDAGFILAKTEFVPVSDYKWEEDYWAAGIEWMEALGADIVSSSVGYNTFVDSTSYTWQHGDFNGRTAVSSLAAVRAAELGVVVSDAMGNEGNGNGNIGTMLVPADADSIISVGAVSFSGQLASFSSTGPTNDNRIKPDVVAPGTSVYCALTSGFSSYGYATGTSLATPLTGGTAALILSARPELAPIQVRNALRNTALPLTDSIRFPTSPNNFTGWGLINAFNAALSFGPIFSDRPTLSIVDSSSIVTISVASKFGIKPNTVLFHYAIGSSSFSSIAMTLDSSMFFPTSGRYTITVPMQARGTVVRFSIDAIDSSSNSYQSPPAIANKFWQLNYGISGIEMKPRLPQGYALLQNYPNPFNPTTKITYDLPRREHVKVQVFNVLGDLIATLVDEVEDAGNATSRQPLVFDGADFPSGVYFYRITTPSFTSTMKMMLIR